MYDLGRYQPQTSSLDIQNYYNQWEAINCWPQPVPTPIIYSYYTHTIEDKGTKALSILKAMMKHKLIEIKTVEQFIDIMDELVKIL